MSISRQERIHQLETQTQRFQRRIKRLDQYSTRYSWIRLAIFFLGLGITFIAWMAFGWIIGAPILCLTLVCFGIVANIHGKIDRSLIRHTHWVAIKTMHLARMNLAWEALPPTQEPSASLAEHPFAHDLDIIGDHSLHRLLNTATSREGGQLLLSWLLTTTPDLPTIQQRQALIAELTTMPRFRDRLLLHSLLAFSRTRQQLEGKRLQRWLKSKGSPTALKYLLLLSSILHIITLLLFIISFFLQLPQLWILTLLANLLLFFATAEQRGDIFDDANYLHSSFTAFRNIFIYLEHYPYGNHPLIKKFCAPFYASPSQQPSQLLRGTARIASAATLRSNGLLWLMINAVLPWDFFCAYRLNQYKKRIAASLPQWLDTWFELEALSSLATFAYLHPDYTIPTLLNTPEEPMILQGQGLGHPLLHEEKKIVNDFALQQEGEIILLTGSNMAGKSTFLRTLGVNLCLAYSGASVNAYSLRVSLMRLFTCVRVSDSVTDGYSYFYAEVRRLKALLVALDEEHSLPLFFLIDEIFKGTNNRERLIGSSSYIHALINKNCTGAITTHDLELVTLAESVPNVKNYHFREEIRNGQMVFEYILRLGPCPTTNALKIMQMEGLPISVPSDCIQKNEDMRSSIH